MRKISEKAMSRKMLRCWNSTREISKRAPHQLFWPNICDKEEKTSVNCTATTIKFLRFFWHVNLRRESSASSWPNAIRQKVRRGKAPIRTAGRTGISAKRRGSDSYPRQVTAPGIPWWIECAASAGEDAAPMSLHWKLTLCRMHSVMICGCVRTCE